MEEYKFRGKTIDELSKLSNEELAKIANADFRRAIKRGFSPEEKIFLTNMKKKAAKSKAIRTHMREMK